MLVVDFVQSLDMCYGRRAVGTKIKNHDGCTEMSLSALRAERKSGSRHIAPYYYCGSDSGLAEYQVSDKRCLACLIIRAPSLGV